MIFLTLLAACSVVETFFSGVEFYIACSLAPVWPPIVHPSKVPPYMNSNYMSKLLLEQFNCFSQQFDFNSTSDATYLTLKPTNTIDSSVSARISDCLGMGL